MTTTIVQIVPQQVLVDHSIVTSVAQTTQRQALVDHTITVVTGQTTRQQMLVDHIITTTVGQTTQVQTAIGIPGPSGGSIDVTGPQGVPGIQGVKGDIGATGNAGAVGQNGVAGADSTVAGPKGDVGLTGADSTVPGPKGDTGITGAAGTTTWAGITDKPATFPPAAHNQALATITDVTATATELNHLDGILPTVAELNFVDGVTSAIQTQLNAKVASATISAAGAELINDADAAAQRATLGLRIPAIGRVVRTAADYASLSSTSFVNVDATNMSITLTTGARRVFISVGCTAAMGTSVPHSICLDVTIDGTRQGQTFGLQAIDATAIGVAVNLSFSYLSDVLSAGAHTFKLQYRVTGGVLIIYASASVTPLTFSVIEQAS